MDQSDINVGAMLGQKAHAGSVVNSKADPGNGIKGTHICPPPPPVLDFNRYTSSFNTIDIIFCIMQLLLSNFSHQIAPESVSEHKNTKKVWGACPHRRCEVYGSYMPTLFLIPGSAHQQMPIV